MNNGKTKKNSCCLVSLLKISCFIFVIASALYFFDDVFTVFDFFDDDETSAAYSSSSAYEDEEDEESLGFEEESSKLKEVKPEESESENSIAEPEFTLSDVFYYYTELSGDELKIYKLMLQGMNNHEDSIILPADIENKLRKIYDMVMNDHPELFWVNSGFSYYSYSDRTELMPDYGYSAEEAEEKQWEISTALNNFRATLSEEDSDYDIIRKAYLYIIDTVDYVDGSSDNQNIISALVNGQSVCAGYARAFQYLLQNSGIQSFYVHGASFNDDGWDSHAWNIVRCGDQYYHVDSTYGDNIADERMISLGIHNYAYFCIDDASIGRDHKISEELPVPECNSLDLNYYVQSGRYFDYYDDSVVSSLYDSVYNGEYYWSCQFSNYDAYAACLSDISAENGLYARAVSEYIWDTSYISYIYNDTTYTITCYY